MSCLFYVSHAIASNLFPWTSWRIAMIPHEMFLSLPIRSLMGGARLGSSEISLRLPLAISTPRRLPVNQCFLSPHVAVVLETCFCLCRFSLIYSVVYLSIYLSICLSVCLSVCVVTFYWTAYTTWVTLHLKFINAKHLTGRQLVPIVVA